MNLESRSPYGRYTEAEVEAMPWETRVKFYARRRVMDDVGKNRRGQDVEGKVPCPRCETGVISYFYCGGYNGHVGLKCSTPECLQWQE